MLASSYQQLSKYLAYSSSDLAKIDLSQPKPTTWLVKSNEITPPSLLGTSKKIAVRITQHADIQSICNRVGPIVSTSANLSGQPICKDLTAVRKIFGPSIDYLCITNDIGTHQPSTVIDLDSGTVIRK